MIYRHLLLRMFEQCWAFFGVICACTACTLQVWKFVAERELEGSIAWSNSLEHHPHNLTPLFSLVRTNKAHITGRPLTFGSRGGS